MLQEDKFKKMAEFPEKCSLTLVAKCLFVLPNASENCSAAALSLGYLVAIMILLQYAARFILFEITP